MSNRQQRHLLFAVIFLSVIGSAIPYTILAPYLFNGFSQGSSQALTKLGFILGLVLAAYPLGGFFGSPIIGRLADRHGRKRLLVITLLASVVGYLLSGFAIIYHDLTWLVISRLLTGFLESNYSVAQAFLIDITHDKQRDLGFLTAVSSLGYVVGPLIGGLLSNKSLVGWFGYSLPFFFTALLAVLLAFASMMVLRESLSSVKTTTGHWLEGFNLFKSFSFLLKEDYLKWCLLASGLLSIAMTIYYRFFPVLLVGGWQVSVMQLSIWTAVLSVSIAVGSLYLSALIAQVKQVFFILLALMLLGFWMLISSHKSSVDLSFVVLGLVYGAAYNLFQVELSNIAPSDRQAEVFGLRLSLVKLANGLVCLLCGGMISFSMRLPIILAMGFILLSFFALLIMQRKRVGVACVE